MGPGATLLVDPDNRVLLRLSDVLIAAGYTPRLAGTYEDAVGWLKAERFDFLVTAHRLITHNGLHLVLRATTERPHLGAVVTTPIPDPVLVEEAAGFGALTVIAPWLHPGDLLSVLARSKRGQPTMP
jgi:DNA-binding NtrC family response regulator